MGSINTDSAAQFGQTLPKTDPGSVFVCIHTSLQCIPRSKSLAVRDQTRLNGVAWHPARAQRRAGGGEDADGGGNSQVSGPKRRLEGDGHAGKRPCGRKLASVPMSTLAMAQ